VPVRRQAACRRARGARPWRTSGPLDYNLEIVAQTGRFGDDDIRAWTIASDTGYRIEAAGSPRVGLRADITSGDRNPGDTRLGTFNPLFPKGAYFGLIASAGPANRMDLHPWTGASTSNPASPEALFYNLGFAGSAWSL
jgi:hypothetical protein